MGRPANDGRPRANDDRHEIDQFLDQQFKYKSPDMEQEERNQKARAAIDLRKAEEENAQRLNEMRATAPKPRPSDSLQSFKTQFENLKDLLQAVKTMAEEKDIKSAKATLEKAKLEAFQLRGALRNLDAEAKLELEVNMPKIDAILEKAHYNSLLIEGTEELLTRLAQIDAFLPELGA